MQIEIFTIFPDLVSPWASASLIGKARRSGARHRGPRPAGGRPRPPPHRRRQPFRRRSGDGAGAGAGVRRRRGGRRRPGRCSCSGRAAGASTRPGPPSWRRGPGFSLLCGRYEGVDQRVADHLVDGELSIGDYVLAGGEAAAIVVVEAVARLVPGVMGNVASAEDESFADGLLEYPQYTRPARVPRLGRSPRCCSRGTTSGSPGGGGRRRWPARCSGRPDLIAARGGHFARGTRPCWLECGFDARSLS